MSNVDVEAIAAVLRETAFKQGEAVAADNSLWEDMARAALTLMRPAVGNVVSLNPRQPVPSPKPQVKATPVGTSDVLLEVHIVVPAAIAKAAIALLHPAEARA